MSDFELSIVPRSPRFKSPLQDNQGLASSSFPGFFHASSLPLASACSLCQDPDLSHVSVVTPQWEVPWTLLAGLSHLFLLRAFAYNNCLMTSPTQPASATRTGTTSHLHLTHNLLSRRCPVNVAAGKGMPGELSVRISFCQVWESSAFVPAHRDAQGRIQACLSGTCFRRVPTRMTASGIS